jgi:hypothetical protein
LSGSYAALRVAPGGIFSEPVLGKFELFFLVFFIASILASGDKGKAKLPLVLYALQRENNANWMPVAGQTNVDELVLLIVLALPARSERLTDKSSVKLD